MATADKETKFLSGKSYVMFVEGTSQKYHPFATSDETDGLSRDCQWIKPLDDSLEPLNMLPDMAKETLKLWLKI